MEEIEKIQATEFTALQQAGLAKKEQSYVEGWARQERDGEVQIVCTFAEQEVEDGAQVFGHQLAVVPATGGRRSSDGKRRKQESHFGWC